MEAQAAPYSKIGDVIRSIEHTQAVGGVDERICDIDEGTCPRNLPDLLEDELRDIEHVTSGIARSHQFPTDHAHMVAGFEPMSGDDRGKWAQGVDGLARQRERLIEFHLRGDAGKFPNILALRSSNRPKRFQAATINNRCRNGCCAAAVGWRQRIHMDSANEEAVMNKVEDIFSVRGKKAVVTGGTKGIGLAIAQCLMDNGCDVAVLSRHVRDTGHLEEYAQKSGVRFCARECDVTASQSCAQAVRSLLACLGGIDILINCAGTLELAFVGEMSDEAWRRTLSTNLDGAFYMTREVSRVMQRQNHGRIINLSSMKSLMDTSKMGYAAYCASKGGINMLTKQCAAELGRYGITVNAIAPTFIETDLNRGVLEKDGYREKLESRIPVGRIGRTDDLMGLILLLCSDASAFISGQILYLDGGLSAAQE